MSLIKCSECGNEVSDKAKACPKCGAPILLVKTNTKNNADYKISNGSIIAIIVVAIMIVIGVLSGKQEQVEKRSLTAGVLNQDESFLIRNKDKFTWRNCDVDLNDDYHIKNVSLKSAEQISISAREFATKDGKRFNPMEMKAKTIFIYCRETRYGVLSHSGGWD